MKRKEHTKHHYIPRCYLRGFAHNNGKTVYAYDKFCSDIKDVSIKSVCTIDNLYEISNRYADNFVGESEDKKLLIEKEHFADYIEPTYAYIINQTIAHKNSYLNAPDVEIEFSYEYKLLIAKFIVIQFLRLPEVMEAVLSDYIAIEQSSFNALKQLISVMYNMPEAKKLEMSIDTGGAFLTAKVAMCNNDLIDSIAEKMAHNYWSFKISPCSGFYTSDFPIVVDPFVKDATPEYFGLAQYGGILSFPLTKDILITIADHRYFKDMESSDGRFCIIDDKDEDYYNRLRYLYAKRFVFSYNNSLNTVEKLAKDNNGVHIFARPNFSGMQTRTSKLSFLKE